MVKLPAEMIFETMRYPLLLGLIVLSALGLSACKIGTPFRMADNDRANTSVDKNQTVMVGITHVVVGQNRKRTKTFWNHVKSVQGSLEEQPGFIGGAIRRELFGNEAWTMTVWTDEESLNGFVRSQVHRTAMTEGWPALKSARFARMEVSRDQIPLSWKQAEELLDTVGRSYTVGSVPAVASSP